MKRKRAFILFVVSILALATYMGRILWKEYQAKRIPIEYTYQIMGIPVVESLDLLDGKEKCSVTENPGVCFENTRLPYSSRENTLYLSQNIENEKWIGSFSTEEEGAFLCMLPDEYWDCKEQAIREGHSFTLWLVTEDVYYELALVISGMPVIEMSTERMEEQEKVPYEVDPDKLYFDSEDLYYGTIRIFDSGVSSDKYEITECRVRYHHKGATTSNFEKKGYSISLQNICEDNLDVSLLGMRADNSWKLNAMVTDDNRLREMTASQIWEQLDEANKAVNEAGPRMEYVELVLDNDYKGLYCLVEPVDEEKLELDGNDVLYKVLGWDPFTDEDVQLAINNRWKIMSPVRIRFPEAISDYEVAWYPMRDYINKLHYNWDGFKNVAEMVYPENAYDMLMFLMVTSGSDNYFKNMYYAADVKADGSYTMRQIPWDLDYTFGNVYDYNGKNFTRFDSDVSKTYVEVSNAFLRQYYPESVNEILLNKWFAYRAGFLNTESIQQLMIENRDYLISTGVVNRENSRWPEYAMSTDIDYLLDFQAERMDWLDGYFGGLAN